MTDADGHYLGRHHVDLGLSAETRTGWRIAAIAHNQMPRLRACLARRQSGK